MLATLSGYFTYFLFAAAIAPYGGQNIGPTRFFIYGPGPGWFLLAAWWFVAVSLRIYSFLVWKEQALSMTRRYNRIAVGLLALLTILELVILMDLQDDFF